MNVKAEKFDVLVADIEKSGNTWFTKDVIEGDEYNTVVYHGRLEIHGNSLPVFIDVYKRQMSMCYNCVNFHILECVL